VCSGAQATITHIQLASELATCIYRTLFAGSQWRCSGGLKGTRKGNMKIITTHNNVKVVMVFM
jgi:hypothetical protein